MMADPKQLYREIVDLERQLRELLRANPLNAQDANVLRSRLVDRAKALATASPTLAAAKELEQVLWKPVFYRRIEDFRLRIRKYAAATDRSGVREHFARVSSDFQLFLRDAAAFYDHLRACYSTWLDGHAPNAAIAQTAAARCRQSLHRCFVFLGDLARYRELHSQRAKKNFAAAESFYHSALALVPANGNPHNQLAVLATYVEAETVAVYRYCRSLLIAQPFATAEENLALLFERARQRPVANTPPAQQMLTPASSAKDKSAALKRFLHRLTRLHGILFATATTATNVLRPSSANATNPSSTSSSSSNKATPTYVVDVETAVLDDLRALLRAGAVGDALLLKVVAIHVFCVVRALQSASRDAQVHAVALAARTLAAVMAFVTTELARIATPLQPPPSSTRLLGPVSVFCDFLSLWPTALDVLAANGDANGSNPLTAAAAAAATEFVDALVAFVNHATVRALVAPLRNDPISHFRAQQLQLKENVELRGFAPFAALLDAPGQTSNVPLSDPATNAPSSVTEADALRLRAWNVVRFSRFLCDTRGAGHSPLLFRRDDDTVATTPAAPVATNSFLHAVARGSASAINGVSVTSGRNGSALVPPPQLQPTFSSFVAPVPVPQHVRPTTNDDDDDFDDEVIVFQPSPALSSLPSTVTAAGAWSGSTDPLGRSNDASWVTGSSSGSAATGSTVPPFADLSGSAFSLAAPNSQSTPETKRQSISDAFSFGPNSQNGQNGPSGGAIGGTLGYPNFHSFGGDFGGFSGSGLLTGWGNSDSSSATVAGQIGQTGQTGFSSLGRPPSVPKPPSAFGTANAQPPQPQPFAPMLDLAAVERESALYQQEASSLSAFFGGSNANDRSALSMPQRRRSSTSSLGSAAPRTSTRPPPGFGSALAGPDALDAPQLFTRNPFINP